MVKNDVDRSRASISKWSGSIIAARRENIRSQFRVVPALDEKN